MNPAPKDAGGDAAAPEGGPVRLLYCRCAFAQVIPAEVKDEIGRAHV